MGIILKENNLIYTNRKHDKFLGSSKYRYDTKTNFIIKKEKKKPVIVDAFPDAYESSFSENYIKDGIKKFSGYDNLVSVVRNKVVPSVIDAVEIQSSDAEKEKKPMRLNKKLVREKCSAFFGLRSSKYFCAFYTISFPLGFLDDYCMKCFNTLLTRLHKVFKLRSYLWVAERQKNGTLHFHMLTNTRMRVNSSNEQLRKRSVNYFMAKAIETQINKYSLDINFDVSLYNGVDVKPVNNNRKALNQYLTKYVSKNNTELYRRPYHSSRDISELFTAETFYNENCADFKFIKEALKYIETFVVDSEYCTIEYLNQMQSNGKFFNPPDSWYWLLSLVNNAIYNNHYAKYKHDKLKLF